MRFSRTALAILSLLVTGLPVLACSLCQGGGNRLTLRQEVAQSKLVLYGTLSNPRLNNVAGGDGITDFQVQQVIKRDPFLGKKKSVELPRYVPVNPKDPPKLVVFCDILNGKLDPYRGLSVKSPAMVTYLQGALAFDANDRAKALAYFFDFLDDREPEIAADAFLEFARASDHEVGQVARKLKPQKLRTLLQSPLTPPERIGLLGFLLGACGTEQDADLLQRLVTNPPLQVTQGISGLLSGFVELRPRQGWALAEQILRDDKRRFDERYGVIQMLRFYHGWKPEESRQHILRCLRIVLANSDLADMAVEDLRRWKYWDLTGEVLALHSKQGQAPLLRRTLLRYLLCSSQPEAKRVMAELRQKEPQLIREVEETLQFEKEK